jgi:hypothetical protein
MAGADRAGSEARPDGAADRAAPIQAGRRSAPGTVDAGSGA